jgi:hypothetical protein
MPCGQGAGRRIEQARTLGAGKFATFNTLAQLSFEMAIQSAQRRFLQPFFRNGQDQQIGFYRFDAGVPNPDFHTVLA